MYNIYELIIQKLTFDKEKKIAQLEKNKNFIFILYIVERTQGNSC